MTNQHDTGYLRDPRPVRWTPERAARGAAASPTAPRCPVRGCVVRFADGADRLCRWHRAEDEAAELDARFRALARVKDDTEHPWPNRRDVGTERMIDDGQE